MWLILIIEFQQFTANNFAGSRFRNFIYEKNLFGTFKRGQESRAVLLD